MSNVSKLPDHEVFVAERDGQPDLIFNGRLLAKLEYPNGASVTLFETERGRFVVAVIDVDEFGDEVGHRATALSDVDSVFEWFELEYGPMSRTFKNLARRCAVTRPDLFQRAVEII